MDKSIENQILNNLLELNKGMYEKAEHPHNCGICTEDNGVGYRMKLEHVKDWQQPYLFICNECYEDLPDGQ